MKRSTRGLFGSLAMLGLLAFSSCLKESDNSLDSVAAAMAVNAVPGSEGLVLALDNNQLNNHSLGEWFKYSKMLPYRRVYPGNRLLRAFHPQKVSSNQEILRKNVNFDIGEYYTLFVVGTKDEDMDVLCIADSLRSPEAGKAFVRFANLSPDAPALELGIDGREAMVATGTPFKHVSSYTSLSSGQKLKFFIREVGTSEPVHEFELTLNEKHVYSIYAKGLLEQENPELPSAFSHGVIVH